MTREDEEMLLADLCARLPYYTKADDIGEIFTIRAYHPSGFIDDFGITHRTDNIKPYLLPPSSMTEEQKEKYVNLQVKILYTLTGQPKIEDVMSYIDWCNKNHIDYRGWIEKGLAIDATNLNIY